MRFRAFEVGVAFNHELLALGLLEDGQGLLQGPTESGQAVVELLFGPCKEFQQRGRIQLVARREFRVADLREAVPRAAELAVVAAVDAIAKQGAELFRDRAVEFDAQVRNAAPGVDLVGGDDGAGRAGVNAGGATARDVRTLMDNVRDIVYKKYGVTLEPEVKFLGDFEA